MLLRQGYNCSVKMGHMIKHFFFFKQGTVKPQLPKWDDSESVALRSESRSKAEREEQARCHKVLVIVTEGSAPL